MAQDPGRLNVPSGGSSMPPDLMAAITQGLAGVAAGEASSATRSNIVPLWRARPRGMTERVNPGQFGDDVRSSGGGRVTAGRAPLTLQGRESYTPNYAASSFLDMEDEDRAAFERLAIASGLMRPTDEDPDALANAWRKAVGYAADYNQDRDEGKWISPWEAVARLGAEQAAREGGAYDPFKPRTVKDSRKISRDFLKGEGAEAITRTLESLFNSEMGRAPTVEERAVYQKLVQKAYDASPEVQETTTTTDVHGNSNSESVQSGGIDTTATLLDSVREDPETQAFAAGSTFFEAAMRALGAIA